MITFKNLNKAFGSKVVYRDLNISIQAQTFQAIIGRSGCGKSVLLKHILGMLQPDAGEVWVNQLCVNQASELELNHMRQDCSMVFQGGALFDSLTVWENVSFGLHQQGGYTRQKCRDVAQEKLSWVGLESTMDQYPSELSGGMCKRVAIARAIAIDPQIILYDEPTAGLDPITSDVINCLMRDLHERIGATSIVVTHDLASAYHVCDEMAMMYNGSFIVHDKVEAVRHSDNPYVKQFLEGSSTGPIGVEVT